LPKKFHHWVRAVVEKERVGPHFNSAHVDGLLHKKKAFWLSIGLTKWVWASSLISPAHVAGLSSS